MNNYWRICLVLFLTLGLVFSTPIPAKANSLSDAQVIFGSDYTLAQGETRIGDVIIIGGEGTIEEGAKLDGSIVITGGVLKVYGTITGDITAFGGSVTLADSADIEGSINLVSTSFTQNNAHVGGTINYNSSVDLNGDNTSIGIPSLPNVPNVSAPSISSWWNPGLNVLINFFWTILRILAIAALSALVVLLLPKPTQRLTQSMVGQPALSLGLGLLTVFVAPALVVLLCITIILIPVGLIGALIVVVAALFGWVAVGYEVGQRLANAFKQTWAPALSAGIGSLI